MSDTPHQDKLNELLFGDPNKQLKHIHVSWGPKAATMTAEEKAAYLYDAITKEGTVITDIDNYQPPERSKEPPKSSVPQTNLEEYLRGLNDVE